LTNKSKWKNELHNLGRQSKATYSYIYAYSMYLGSSDSYTFIRDVDACNRPTHHVS
jgi:hypothetical protein